MHHIETTFSILDIYIQCEYLLNLVRNKFISGEEKLFREFQETPIKQS